MALTLALRGKNVYDGKRIWIARCEMGRAATNTRIKAWCQENGMYDPAKGRPSNMGPAWAMWRWAINNTQEAWPYYEKWAKEHIDEIIARGKVLSFDLFLQDLEEHAKNPSIVGRRTYLDWCREWEVQPKKYI